MRTQYALIGALIIAFAWLAQPNPPDAQAQAQPAQGSHQHPPLNDVGQEALRFCESTNNYTSVHLDVDGQYVYGAYQFKWATWTGAIRTMGADWQQWGNVRPDSAPAHVQGAVAAHLWGPNGEGAHHWLNCHTAAVNAMTDTPDKRVSSEQPPPGQPVAPIPNFTG